MEMALQIIQEIAKSRPETQRERLAIAAEVLVVARDLSTMGAGADQARIVQAAKMAAVALLTDDVFLAASRKPERTSLKSV